MARHDLNVMHYICISCNKSSKNHFYFMKCKCNAKSLLQPGFCVFRTTFTMPSRNPPASMRRGKGFTKAETTTLLKAIERILPIDAEGWTEVHDIFNSKHSPQGVEGLKRKFNKLANKPVPTGNLNIPEDVKLAKSIKGKFFVVLEPQTSPTRRKKRKRTRKKKNLMMTSLQKPSTKI